MPENISKEWIMTRRKYNYCLTPERRIQTIEGARQFVEQVGFCHFWPIKGIETPNLFHAIAGRVRPVPKAHGDPDLSKCWAWKDKALDKRWWYYGKLLRRRATLVSLDLLPSLYACTENYGGLDDYLDEYRAGTMTAEAKQIYETLLEKGPLDKIRLRRETHTSSKRSKSRFDRALVELQVGLKVLPIGVTEAGAWNYAFEYEIVQRYYPDLPEKARPIKRSQARRTLVARYLDNVVAADRKMIEKVFHIFRWTKAELDRTLETLRQENLVCQVRVEGLKHPQFLSTIALDRDP
jgi:hypothetical protein